MTDDQIRDRLRDLDESDDISVTSWEAGFIEIIVYKYRGPLSHSQRQSALQMIEKYDV